MLNYTSGNQKTSYDEMRDVLDDLADDMSQAVTEVKWTELIIYLIESMESRVKDREEFNSMGNGRILPKGSPARVRRFEAVMSRDDDQ